LIERERKIDPLIMRQLLVAGGKLADPLPFASDAVDQEISLPLVVNHDILAD
jgi:hypothetical protein